MFSLTIDIDKLKKPNSGLGQFCKHLVTEIHNQLPKTDQLTLVGSLPALKQMTYLNKANLSEIGVLDKWTGVKVKTIPDVWWATHQEAKLLPRSKKTKIVLTIHDLNFLDKYSGSKRAKHLSQVQKLVDKTTAIVFISNYTQKIANEHLKLEDKPQWVIYNGIALDLKVKREPISQLKNAPFLFSIGIFSEKKNFHTLLKMMQHLPAYTLVLAGNNDTSYGAKIKQEVVKNGLEKQVVLLGEITEGEKLWLYAHCVAFVFPSLQEGFGLPVLEALSFDKPTIISNYTSLPEIGGKVVDYFESFEPEHMASTVKNSIQKGVNPNEITEHLQKFSWQKAAQKYWEVFENIKTPSNLKSLDV
jgi:glycosyltransferase involved in cell wall biosynthesis